MPAFYKEWFYRGRLALTGGVLRKPQPRPLTFTGPGASLQLCRTVGQFGIGSLLIVTDTPLRELGLLDDILGALEAAGVETRVYDGVLPDPTEKVVDEGIALLHAHACAAVLAVGGGSSIDCAKVIALGSANRCNAEDCVGLNKCKLPALPFFAIPTTAGTGSESTCIAVISDNETHAKNGVIDHSLIPRIAALDPVLMQGLPPALTAATGMDALTHAIESYIGTLGNADTDFFSLAAAKLIFEHLPEAYEDGANLQAREAMALASYYGGLAISQTLVGYAHAISHNLGAKYGIPHGLGNAMALPHVLECLQGDATRKMAELALHAGIGESGESPSVLAQKLVDRVRTLNRRIGIPETSEAIQASDIEELVDLALAEGSSYPTPRYFDRGECRSLIERLVPG